MKKLETARLMQLGNSFIALGNAVQALELQAPQLQEDTLKLLYSKVYQQVCVFCSKKSWCWEEERTYTMEALAEACNKLEERGIGTETAFNSKFQGRCLHGGRLEVALLNQIEAYKRQQSQQQMEEECRDNIAHQLVLLGEQIQFMRVGEYANPYSQRLVVGHASSKREQVSGDSWDVQDLQDGRMVQILSDGMGSGELAMQQSQLAVQLLQVLLSGGLSVRLSLSMINTVLSFQYQGMRFSTMDVALWNLNSCKLELYKYGSVPSFIKNGRNVTRYIGESLPVGMLPRVEAVVLEHEITDGDLLIMMSDGVYELDDEGFQWEQIISNLPVGNPQLLAEYLLAIATSRIRSNHKKMTMLDPDKALRVDDMTVLVSRLVR